MEHQAANRVEIAGLTGKGQITTVFYGNLKGEFLPIQLKYTGKTERCNPRFQFPADWHMIHSTNHLLNENTMLEYIYHIIVPFV